MSKVEDYNIPTLNYGTSKSPSSSGSSQSSGSSRKVVASTGAFSHNSNGSRNTSNKNKQTKTNRQYYDQGQSQEETNSEVDYVNRANTYFQSGEADPVKTKSFLDEALGYAQTSTSDVEKKMWTDVASQVKQFYNSDLLTAREGYQTRLAQLQEEHPTLARNRENARRSADISMAAKNGTGETLKTAFEYSQLLKENEAETKQLLAQLESVNSEIESSFITPEVSAAIEALKANDYSRDDDGRAQHDKDQALVDEFRSSYGLGQEYFNGADRFKGFLKAAGNTIGKGFTNAGAMGMRAIDYGLGLGNANNMSNEDMLELAYVTDPTQFATTNADENMAEYGRRWENTNRGLGDWPELSENNPAFQTVDSTWARGAADTLEAEADKMYQTVAQETAKVKEGMGGFGRFMVDAGIAGVGVVTDSVTGAVTGTGPLVPMFIRVFGDSAQEARLSGASYSQQLGTGFSTASVEVVTEKMFGGFSKLGYGKGFLPVGGVEKALTDLAKSDAGKLMIKTLAGASEEGMEEVFSDLAQPFIKQITDEEARGHYFSELEKEDLFRDYLLGATLGLVGQATSVRSNVNDINQSNLQSMAQASQAQARGETLTPEQQMRLTDGNQYGGLSVKQAQDLKRGMTKEEARQQKADRKETAKEQRAERLHQNFVNQAGVPEAETKGAHQGTPPETRGAHEYREKHGGEFTDNPATDGLHAQQTQQEETPYDGAHAVEAAEPGQHTEESARDREKTRISKEADYEPQARHDGGQKYEPTKEAKPADDSMASDAFDSITASKTKSGLREEDTSAGRKKAKEERNAKEEAAKSAVTFNQGRVDDVTAKKVQGVVRKNVASRTANVIKKLGKGEPLSSEEKLTAAEARQAVNDKTLTPAQAKKATMSDDEARTYGKNNVKGQETNRVQGNRKAIEARRKLARGEELAPEDKLTRKEAETAFNAGLINQSEMKKYTLTNAEAAKLAQSEPAEAEKPVKGKGKTKQAKPTKNKDERKNHADRAAALGYDEDTDSVGEQSPKAPAQEEQSAPVTVKQKPIERASVKNTGTKREAIAKAKKEYNDAMDALHAQSSYSQADENKIQQKLFADLKAINQAYGSSENTPEQKQNSPAETKPAPTERVPQSSREYADQAKAIAKEVTDKIKAAVVDKKLSPERVSKVAWKDFARIKPGDKLSAKVTAFFDSLGNRVKSNALGGQDVVIDKTSVKADIAHGVGRAKACTFKAVPDVLANGTIIDEQTNWKGRGYDTKIIAGAVDIDGKPAYVGCVVSSVKEGDHMRFYLHEVVDGKGNLIYSFDNMSTAEIKEGPDVEVKTGIAESDTGTTPEPETSIPQKAVETQAKADLTNSGKRILDDVNRELEARARGEKGQRPQLKEFRDETLHVLKALLDGRVKMPLDTGNPVWTYELSGGGIINQYRKSNGKWDTIIDDANYVATLVEEAIENGDKNILKYLPSEKSEAEQQNKSKHADAVASIKEGESKRFDFSDGSFHSTYYVQNKGDDGYNLYTWSDIGHSGEPIEYGLTAESVTEFLDNGGGNTFPGAKHVERSITDRIVDLAKNDFYAQDEAGSEDAAIYQALSRALENDEINVKEFKAALRKHAPTIANKILEEPPEAKLNNIKDGDTAKFSVYDPLADKTTTYYVRNNGKNGYAVYSRGEPLADGVAKDDVLDFLQDDNLNHLYYKTYSAKQDAVEAANEAVSAINRGDYSQEGHGNAAIDAADSAYRAIEQLYFDQKIDTEDAINAILETVDINALTVGVQRSNMPMLMRLAVERKYSINDQATKDIAEDASKATPEKPFVFTPPDDSKFKYIYDGTTIKKVPVNGRKAVRTITDRVAVDELLQSFFAEAGENPASEAPATQPTVEEAPSADVILDDVILEEEPVTEVPPEPQEPKKQPQPSTKKKFSKQAFRDESQLRGAKENAKVEAPFEFGKYDSASTEEVSRVADYRIEQNGYDAEIERLNKQKSWDRTDFAEAQRLVFQRTKQIYDQMASDEGLVSRGKYETTKSWQARCEARYQELRAPIDELLETYRAKKSEAAQKLQQNYKFNLADEIRMRAAHRFLNFTENGRVSYNGRSSANVRMYRIINNVLAKAEKSVAEEDLDGITKIILDVSTIRGNDNLFGDAGRKGEADGIEFLKASGATAEDLANFAYGNINRMIDDFTPVKPLEAVEQFRVLNMLSNIKTGLNNIFNNFAGSGVNAVAQNIGNVAAKQFERATGKKVAIKDTSMKFNKETIKAEEVAFVTSALMSYYGIRVDNGRIELQNAAKFNPNGNWFEKLGARYSFFVNTFVMNPDQMGKARIDLGLQAGIDAAFEGVEMTPEMIANKKELEGYKELEKNRRLVQEDNKTTRLVQHFKEWLNNAKIGNDNIGYLKLGNFAMAFAKVPVNIGQQRIAATPYGAVYHLLNAAKGYHDAVKMHQAVLEGQPGAKEMSAKDMAKYSRDVGRAATTGGMLAIGAVAAMCGALKDFGNDDDKDDETRIWREKGYTGLTLNVSSLLRLDKKWRDSDWVVGADFLEIFAAPLSIGAMAWEAHKDGMSVAEASWYATKRSFTDILDAIADIPGMQAASQLYEAYTYSTSSEDDLSKTWSAVRQYLANSASSYVMPNLFTQTATALDNKVRNPYAADNAWQQSWQIFANKIPFLRNTLPVKTDAWGNERTYGENRFVAFMNKVVLPGQIRQFKTNKYEKEIIRLSREGYGGLLSPSSYPKKIEIGDNTYELTSDQKLAYEAAYKDRFTEVYEAFMDSDYYQQLNDPQRQAALKLLRLDVTRQTEQDYLDAIGATEEVTMDKWEDLPTLEEKIAYVYAKQIASVAWDSEENAVADYELMDDFIKNGYTNLSPAVQDVLNNSLTHLDDLYEARTTAGITSKQWQTCYDIYRQYNEKDEEGHALYKANIANAAQMWAEMQSASGLSDAQMNYVEDNMQMHTIISPNDDQYKEYLYDAGFTREETARTLDAMSKLEFTDGYKSVQYSQKYWVIANTAPKGKDWDAFWTVVPGNASKANVANMRRAQEQGLSLADALKNNPMGYIYTKATNSRGKTVKTRIN